MYAACSLHGARFNVEGDPILGPNNSSADSVSALDSYPSQLHESDNNILQISAVDPEGELLIRTGIGIQINIEEVQIEEALVFDSTDTDINGSSVSLIDNSGLLIYRKSETEFNVLSRTCPHQGGSIGSFQNP